MIGSFTNGKLDYNKENSINKEKFLKDCVEIDTPEWKVSTQGYFLNADELQKKYNLSSEQDLLIHLIKTKGTAVSTELFGTYILLAFNKTNNELLISNDLLSKKSLFYHIESNSLFFSDSFFDLVSLLKKNNISLSVDTLGLKMMARYQYFFDDVTYANEIKYLKPFSCIQASASSISIANNPYPKEGNTKTEDDILKDIDTIFTKGVLLQFEKNKKNGHPQITTLSGGWDSRMTFWYGYKNGYHDQTMYCYSQANSIDERIARGIAIECNCVFFHHMLNGGKYLIDRDLMTEANEGQMVYGDTGGIYDCMRMFDTNQWGIVHSGIGGGEIMGDLYKANEEKTWESFIGNLSCNEDEAARIKQIISTYPSYNFFQNFNDIRHCLNAQKSSSAYCHYNSPYLYEEFWLYMMSIPYNLKKNRYIYRKWFKQGCSLKQRTTYHWGVRTSSKIEYNFRRVWHKLLVKTFGISKYDMKPYFYWEKTNPDLMKSLIKIYTNDMHCLGTIVSKTILQDLEHDWNRYDLRMKMNILTILWALKKMYINR